ncbi:MAG: hydantoinase B/oxoprolinase family protein [Acidobacteria bacterium]|nr:hydantoinase B/oxoprolinase family protein [Acidobacteriota bacterium]
MVKRRSDANDGRGHKSRVDPTRLEIFKNVFHSVAEEMGAALRRSAFSPNIKERRDYSCAVYDAEGRVLAMGDHMPVHLGSMPASVAAARAAFALEPGDIALLNDPFAGGTHLPDLTMVMPVFIEAKSKLTATRALQPQFHVASRAHHADVGGALAGSMGPAREIFQEGIRIPPIKIFRRGELNRDAHALLVANVRTPAEREGDLAAQIAACRTGERRLKEIVAKYGTEETAAYGRHLLEYSAEMMRAALREMPTGVYTAEDFIDSDGVADDPLRIRARIEITHAHGGGVRVDFTASSPQCSGNVNAVEAIAVSAVYYVFRCLLSEDVPATSGLLTPIEVIAPSGTIVNAQPPAAVAGGNVETSQRMVDTLLRALAKAVPHRIPAASQGTMNNLTLGGRDERHSQHQNGNAFAYYETTAGGMGARPSKDGASAVHTHMTNSWNTPVEVFEQVYPVRMRRYAVRRGSGGRGKHKGGDGIVREIEILTDMQVGLLCDRRVRGPYGLLGGADGAPGKNTLIDPNGKQTALPGKTSLRAKAGSVLKIETPGGGGWGKASRNAQ